MSGQSRRAQPGVALSFLGVLAALLLFAPLFRGGNQPLALLALELLALGLFVLIVHQGHRPLTRLARWERLGLVLLVALPLVSLLPLPVAWWGALPARSLYLDAMALFGDGAVPAWHSLSVVPHASRVSGLALLPPLAVFLATLVCPEPERRRLVYLFLAMAGLQAVLGLSQYGSREEFLFLGMDSDGSAQGTYTNRNHFAGLFEMALPLAAALFAARFGQSTHSRRYHRPGIRALFAKVGAARINVAALFVGLFLLFGLAIVFSRSRTGIMLLILGIVVLTMVFAPRLGGRQTLRTAAGLVVMLVGFSMAVGLVPVLQRFALQDPLEDARWSIAGATLEGIGAFFPLGAGIGTYPEVFRRFHPDDVPRFINHAHNDYLEWLFEGGILAAVLLLLLLAVYLRRVLHVLRGNRWRSDQYVKVGAAVGIFLLLLHGLVDYNLKTPANAIYFAFLAGLLFAHRGVWEEPSPEPLPETTDQPAEPPARHRPVPLPPSNLPEGVPNPFAL